jgi:AraC-like DNA-binding protein
VDELARLKELLTRNAGEGLTPTALPGVSIQCSRTITDRVAAITEPTLAVIAQGAKETALNGRIFAYGAGQFVITSLELPVVGRIVQASADEPFLAFVLRLRPDKIASLLLETAPAGSTRRGTPDAVAAGIALSDASPSPGDADALAAGIEREVLWRLVTGPQAATVRQIGLADSQLSHLGRAIRYIRSNYEKTLRVEELAGLATMSLSSFHRHFRGVTSMTPIQFQKQIRLHEARVRLLAEPADVAGVGFAVGYESPSQFSREYRRMFGLPPSRDALAMREAALLPSS